MGRSDSDSSDDDRSPMKKPDNRGRSPSGKGRERDRDRSRDRSTKNRDSWKTRNYRKRSRSRSRDRRRSRSRDKKKDRRETRDRDRHRRHRRKSRSRSRSRSNRHRRTKSRSQSRERDRSKKDESSPKRKPDSNSGIPVIDLPSASPSPARVESQSPLPVPRQEPSQPAASNIVQPLMSLPLPGVFPNPGRGLMNEDVAAQVQAAAERLRKQLAEQQLAGATGCVLGGGMINTAARMAEQQKKRALLWKGKKAAEPDTTKEAMWASTTFDDQDSKATEKFRKLMGIKHVPAGASGPSGSNLQEESKRIMENLDAQYEVARMSTHTHRGVGLGFTSFPPSFPSSAPSASK